DIRGRVCSDFHIFVYWRHVRRPLETKTNNDLVRYSVRRIGVPCPAGANARQLAYDFPCDADFSHSVPVLAAVRHAPFQATPPGGTVATGNGVLSIANCNLHGLWAVPWKLRLFAFWH